MPKFFIEVTHESTKKACEEAIRVFLNSGSHFMTNADWGCMDGEHKAWFILNIDSKEEALNIIPPTFRRHAKITALTKFSLDNMDKIKPYHES